MANGKGSGDYYCTNAPGSCSVPTTTLFER